MGHKLGNAVRCITRLGFAQNTLKTSAPAGRYTYSPPPSVGKVGKGGQLEAAHTFAVSRQLRTVIIPAYTLPLVAHKSRFVV